MNLHKRFSWLGNLGSRIVSVRFWAVVCLFLTTGVSLHAQGNQLIFDDQKNEFIGLTADNKPSPNERVIIKCVPAIQYDSIRIRAMWNDQDQEVKAVVSGRQWMAIVGPFPAHARVIFAITRYRHMIPSEIEPLVGAFVESANQYTTVILDKKKAISPETFQKELTAKFTSELGNKGLDANQKTLTEKFLPTLAQSIKDVAPQVTSLDAVYETQFYQSYASVLGAKDTTMPFLADDKRGKRVLAFDEFATQNADVVQQIEKEKAISKAAQKVMYDHTIIPKLTSFLAGKKQLEDIIGVKATEFLAQQTVIVNGPAVAEIAGIHSYIGFDVGLMYIPKLNQTPFFFTLSPYLSKIEVDKDYTLSCDNLLRIFTPTFGISLNTSEAKVSPVYFAGVGCRLNKVARLAVGGTYYLPTGASIYDWSWGFSASINTSFLVEFISAFDYLKAKVQK